MSDITIGQYVEGRSLIHRLDVRVKLVLMLCGITFVFIAGNYFSMALITAFTIFIMLLTGISLFKYIKSIKAVIMIVLFTAILNLFYGSGEPGTGGAEACGAVPLRNAKPCRPCPAGGGLECPAEPQGLAGAGAAGVHCQPAVSGVRLPRRQAANGAGRCRCARLFSPGGLPSAGRCSGLQRAAGPAQPAAVLRGGGGGFSA